MEGETETKREIEDRKDGWMWLRMEWNGRERKKRQAKSRWAVNLQCSPRDGNTNTNINTNENWNSDSNTNSDSIWNTNSNWNENINSNISINKNTIAK